MTKKVQPAKADKKEEAKDTKDTKKAGRKTGRAAAWSDYRIKSGVTTLGA